MVGSEMAVSGGSGSDLGLAWWVNFATHHWDWRVVEIGEQQEQTGSREVG